MRYSLYALGVASGSLVNAFYASASALQPSLPTRSGYGGAQPVRRANSVTTAQLDACPGYKAANVKTTAYSLSADLTLAGPACNVYGSDLTKLKLEVTYETEQRIHVKLYDALHKRYEVPESVLPRPKSSNVNSKKAAISFQYTTSPFTFQIVRNDRSKEVLFGTDKRHPIIFEPQYLRLKTAALPADANIYGLGEHTESFRLPNTNLTRTLWSRDAYGVAPGTNLYGNHPVYFEHRLSGTHGVFLLNSNGMDIKIDQDSSSHSTSVEYNSIGGIFDFYFLAGPEPLSVARQYAQVVGTPAEVPYWGLGLHQCRYGYTDYLDVAAVIANYSQAGIPLETMWTDIDYMYERWTFTSDPDYFPKDKLREIVSGLHARNQHYILMVDPAVAYQPNKGYATYDEGAKEGVYLRETNGSWFRGVVWPGVTVFPDWFHPKAAGFWTQQFARFFNKDTGIDIDGAWIDMNEPASFISYGQDPDEQAKLQNLPPRRGTPPPAKSSQVVVTKRDIGSTFVGNGTTLDLLNPPYAIQNAAGALSDRTASTNIIHENGLTEYDTHNLYGTMMSENTRDALIARRPGLRPFVITRSTFAGAGRKTGKWLGDNLSDWVHYRNSIAGMLGFASIYQIPMVGADVCGFGSNTTENLCARWASLGAFGPFYRNHNELGAISQEFYRWPSVAESAKNAIAIRYRLLDYIYTALHQAHLDGTPILNPLWYFYPSDAKTFGIDLQFLYGSSILVSPVTEENATSVNVYLPKDTFYDFLTYAPVHGKASTVSLSVPLTSIPVHIRGGSVIPLRVSSANTTAALQTLPFEIVVAPSSKGVASGSLYLDDGVSLEQDKSHVSALSFAYSDKTLKVTGQFGKARKSDTVQFVSILGVEKKPTKVYVNGAKVESSKFTWDQKSLAAKVKVDIKLVKEFKVSWA